MALGPAQTLSPSLPSAFLEMGEKVPVGVGSLGTSEHQVLRALSGHAIGRVRGRREPGDLGSLKHVRAKHPFHCSHPSHHPMLSGTP